jgi:hypothetical protein
LVSLKGRDHSEDLDVDERIILKWILRKYLLKDVDWTYLAQDRDRQNNKKPSITMIHLPDEIRTEDLLNIKEF